MGRKASGATAKTTVILNPKLKQQATVYAARKNVTLSALIEEGLRRVMAAGWPGER